ncbi:beta-L-arabinofuranosidase domain-containing protein [Pontiella sulfatireligans]|uniref:Non-reducing end beta-L-arabinofuranosidase n=1 Tax=Pontiella sulfatireligans TaxID=2750658 RepID=A0A6C2UGV6_9BACT|nr:beta-L-arabinofuranosidase domain-containing protein [Pontiella sulfatireligans]VGO18747.1 Non-reducing end beta-L-arabinofuranosidase [Pontiella sulfatireligans]
MNLGLLCTACVVVQAVVTTVFATESHGIGVLEPLPAGAIQPRGWLETMAQAASDGHTGHMEEINEQGKYSLPVASWKNINKKARGWANYEQEGYYLDGLVRLAYQLNDPELIAKAKGEIDPVIDAQKENGSFVGKKLEPICSLGPIDQKLMSPEERLTYKDDGEAPEEIAEKGSRKQPKLMPNSTSRYLWSVSVFNRAVLALYDASGEQKYLDFLVKYYRNFPDYHREVPDQVPVGGAELHFCRHLVNCEVMFEVAQRSGDTLIRDKALKILKSYESGMVETWLRGDFATSRITHGVTFNELFKLYATAPAGTDPRYVAVAETAFRFLQDEHIQPFGVNSANEYLRGIGGFKGTELCNIVDMAWSVTWLARQTGKASYGDVLENAFFNAFPASIDHYQQHSYLISPNRLPGVLCSQNRSTKHDFLPVWKPECCTGNLNRALPNYVMYMAMKTQDSGLAMLTYGPNHISTTVKGTAVEISSQTDYPFKDQLSWTVAPASDVSFPLYLRIPAWCENPVVKVNGKPVNASSADGFVKIDRNWKNGDQVSLQLPMNAVVHMGTELELMDKKTGKRSYTSPGSARVDTVGYLVEGAPFAYVTRGPLLYTLGVAAKDANTAADAGMVYNFAMKPGEITGADVVEHDVKGWVWEYGNAPVQLEIPAQKIDWKIDTKVGALPMQTFKANSSKEEMITLVPFGCAKFRLTAFPVVEAAE